MMRDSRRVRRKFATSPRVAQRLTPDDFSGRAALKVSGLVEVDSDSKTR